MTGPTLSEYWDRAWTLLGTRRPDQRVFSELLARHREPERAYHNLQHLEECFARFEEVSALADRPGEILVALWFHDAVYNSHASDNEERSARWAAEVIRAAGGSGEVGARVSEMILATRHETAGPSGDAGLLVDIDLAILAAPESRFDQYEEQVRQEYRWVPEPIYRSTRARVLRQFLTRPSIYCTPAFQERFDAAARANLERSLRRLKR